MLVSMTNIYCYVEKNLKVTDRKTRPLEEGERLYLAGVVGNCGLENNVVKARCLTSKVSAEPHRIEITFGNYEDYKQWKCLCTCKAGAGEKCKHIVATLLYIYNASDLGPLSCTETEQAWGKRKQKEIVEVIPVDEFCHVPSRSTSAKPLPVVDEFFSLCLQAVPDSEAAVHLSKLRNPNVIMKTVRLYHTKFVVAFNQALAIFSLILSCLYFSRFVVCFVFCFRNEVLEAICHHAKTNNKYWKMLYELDIPSTMSMCCVNTYNEIYPCNALDVCRETLKKEKWCDERKFRITGSRCYSLYTYSKNNWAEKASKYFFDKPFAGNFATNYGVIQEKVARNIYMAHLLEDENIVEVGLVVCQSDPWLACSPDGIIMKNKRPHRLLEIKCPIIGATKSILDCLPKLEYMVNTGEGYELKKKHAYFAQIQFYLSLMNLNTCDFVLFSSFDNSFYQQKIDIEEEFATNLLIKLKITFFNHMLHVLCK